MSKNLYICYTYYHLYVAILEIFYLRKWGHKNNYLIITDHIPKGKEIIKKILKYNFIKKVYYVEDLKLRNRIYKNPFYCLFYKFALSFFFKKENKDLYSEFKEDKDLKINMFLDGTTTSHFYIYNFEENFLLEDGLLVYYSRKKIIKDYIYFLLGIPQRVGRDKRIKKIRVQWPEKLPEDIFSKGERLDLKKYERLSEVEKKELFEIFSLNIKFQNDISKKRCLILTQPLSEVQLVSEKEKIEIYREIIEKYSDYEIFLKKHPGDLTDYSFQVKELNKYFPIELIKFLPNKFFDKIIAIESSAIYNLSEISECINLGFSINKKLYKNVTKDTKK